MAYNLSERFQPPPKYYRLLDPGTYNITNPRVTKTQKPKDVGFLSKTPRRTQLATLWTHAIYKPRWEPRIPNCSSIQSKVPRFPYEEKINENFEEMLCQCGNISEVPEEEEHIEQQEELCQGKVRKRIYKGTNPCSSAGGLSAPSKRDRGFKILSDNSQVRVVDTEISNDPPFYNAVVNEATKFYQGCNWSKWTSKRGSKVLQTGPGPADYNITPELDDTKLCMEYIRAKKRKTSKQFRYIEAVQRLQLLEKRPGPASYSPIHPEKKDFHCPISRKCKPIEVTHYEVGPGPSDYFIRRDFETPRLSYFNICHANLPPPAPFGSTADRFKSKYQKGPSPATYNSKLYSCQIMNCTKAPFGSSEPRFKHETSDSDTDDEIECTNEDLEEKKICKSKPTWQFKSKSIRIKPSVKVGNACLIVDLRKSSYRPPRCYRLQRISPFNCSEGRFKNWFNWIAVHGQEDYPGPAYYSLDPFKCAPAVFRGPLSRDARFKCDSFLTPAPNEFKVGGGIEEILKTHNNKLNKNIETRHKFVWKPPDSRVLGVKELENKLFSESIAILNTGNVFEDTAIRTDTKSSCTSHVDKRIKLLRCFVR